MGRQQGFLMYVYPFPVSSPSPVPAPAQQLLPVLQVLRAPDQKYRESHDRNEISYSILFYQKYLFGKLFSKIIFKSSSAFCSFQNLNKFEIRLKAHLRPPEIRENRAFLASSYATMEIVPVLPFGS